MEMGNIFLVLVFVGVAFLILLSTQEGRVLLNRFSSLMNRPSKKECLRISDEMLKKMDVVVAEKRAIRAHNLIRSEQDTTVRN